MAFGSFSIRRLATTSFWVDDLLIKPKILYFLIFLAVRASVIFRVQFFRDEFKMTTSDFGLMLMVYSFCQFLTAPLWSYVVDKLRRPKLFLLVLSLVGSLLFQLFRLVKPRYAPGDATFGSLLAICIAIVSTTSTLIPLMDKICLSILKRTKGATKEMYGQQRLFGCFGDIAATSILGYMLDKNKGVYDSLYWSVGISEFVFLVVGFVLIPNDEPVPRHDVEKATCKSEKEKAAERQIELEVSRMSRWGRFKHNSKNIMQLVSNYSYLFMLLAALFNGVCKSVGANFVSNFFEDNIDGLGATKAVQSYVQNAGYVFEICSFYFSKPLLENFDSFSLLMAAQVTMIIRFGIHSFLPVGENDAKWIWVAAIGEMFKGLNFGLMQAAGVMVASSEAPPELQATAQGLFAGVYQGLAPSMSGLIGYLTMKGEVTAIAGETQLDNDARRRSHLDSRNGFFDDNNGMFRIASMFAIIALLILILKKGIDRIKRKRLAHKESNLEHVSSIKRLSLLNSQANKHNEKPPSEYPSRDSTVYSFAEDGVTGEEVIQRPEPAREL